MYNRERQTLNLFAVGPWRPVRHSATEGQPRLRRRRHHLVLEGLSPLDSSIFSLWSVVCGPCFFDSFSDKLQKTWVVGVSQDQQRCGSFLGRVGLGSSVKAQRRPTGASFSQNQKYFRFLVNCICTHATGSRPPEQGTSAHDAAAACGRMPR